jgi:Holliday junction resolvasome RuvABC endonuclease subunit
MILLGIDPGLAGGLAAVGFVSDRRAQLLEAIDIPTTGEKAKRRVDVGLVLGFIQRHAPAHAFIERAQAFKDQGSSSGFIYGRAVGALEACIDGMQVPLTVIEPTAWKKAHALIKTGKEDSRQRALRLFPEGGTFLARKMDHGRAEAALIAWYGRALIR